MPARSRRHDQNLVVDESLELADGLLEVRLLAFLDLPLIHEHRLVQRVVDQCLVGG